MKTSASKSPVLIGLIAATAGFAGLAAIVRSGDSNAPGPLKTQFERPIRPPAQERTPGSTREGTTSQKPEITESSVVRYATIQGESPVLSKELTLKPGEDARVRSLAETVKSVGYKNVRVLNVDVEKGAAIVDVSPELLNEGFSSTSESLFVEALARTLGQFDDVKTFQIRVDGQVLDTLGHLELTEPTKVIRPGEKPDESETPSREPNP